MKDRERNRKYYEANRDKVLEACCKWKLANPEKKRESDRKWQKANSKKTQESDRKWRVANPEKHREAVRKSKRKAKQQTAADQFFILAGAAESISKLKLKSE